MGLRQALAEARHEMAQSPGDGRAAVQVAALAISQSGWLRQRELEARAALSAVEAEPLVTFRHDDPDALMAEAAVAAECAARSRLASDERRHAFVLLSVAREALGDHDGAATALERATRIEPKNARLWQRLADAYRRAKRSSHADAAQERALALQQ